MVPGVLHLVPAIKPMGSLTSPSPLYPRCSVTPYREHGTVISALAQGNGHREGAKPPRGHPEVVEADVEPPLAHWHQAACREGAARFRQQVWLPASSHPRGTQGSPRFQESPLTFTGSPNGAANHSSSPRLEAPSLPGGAPFHSPIALGCRLRCQDSLCSQLGPEWEGWWQSWVQSRDRGITAGPSVP